MEDTTTVPRVSNESKIDHKLVTKVARYSLNWMVTLRMSINIASWRIRISLPIDICIDIDRLISNRSRNVFGGQDSRITP
jgi:hypothetical protein